MTSRDDLSVPFKHDAQDMIDEILETLKKADGGIQAIDNFSRYVLNTIIGQTDDASGMLAALQKRDIKPLQPRLKPGVVYSKTSRGEVTGPNEIAIVCPVSSEPVDIWFLKHGEPEEAYTGFRQTHNCYIALPNVHYRVQPGGRAYHLTVLPIETSRDNQ